MSNNNNKDFELDINKQDFFLQCTEARTVGSCQTFRYVESKICNYILRKGSFKTDRMTEMMFWYNPKTGLWVKKGDQVIRTTLIHLLGPEDYNDQEVSKIIKFIQWNSPFDMPNELLTQQQQRPHEIPVENGVLDIITKTLTPYSPDKFFLSKLPIKYDPNAKCPTITKFFYEVFDADQITPFQDALGYSLFGDNRYKKGFFFSGKGKYSQQGNNGKTQVLNILGHFFGESWSTLTVQQMEEEKFERTQLVGKMANICHDVPTSPLESVGILKMIISGDPITAEDKGYAPFKFRPFAKLWMAGNGFPKIKPCDANSAWFDRWIIFVFRNKFEGKNAVPDIGNKLASNPEEMSGLLNWALEGLERVLKQGYLTPNSAYPTHLTWLSQSNSAKAFILQKGIKWREGSWIPAAEFHQIYLRWCNENDVEPESSFQVYKTLQTIFPTFEKPENKRIGDVGVVKALKNIMVPVEYRIKNDDLMEKELADEQKRLEEEKLEEERAKGLAELAERIIKGDGSDE